jgi:hypothetical protein
VNEPGNTKWGWVVVAVLVVLALVVIPIIASGSGNNPEDYLREHYTHVSGEDPEDSGGIVFSSDDDPLGTASDIESGTDADERRQEGEDHYLRYDDDWMVVVAPDGAGSRITFYEFDTGYRTHGGSSFFFFWSSYYNRGGSGGGLFRGGGSGSGK